MGFLRKLLLGENESKEEVVPKEDGDVFSINTDDSNDISNSENHSSNYKAVIISKGIRGWGGPLMIKPTDKKHLIYSVTGGGIHPVAQRIADLTGGIPFDGFKSKADFDEIAVAVIDCGGTARVGVYPMKNVMTVDVHATSPSGPLIKYIKETIFVSGVGLDEIEVHKE